MTTHLESVQLQWQKLVFHCRLGVHATCFFAGADVVGVNCLFDPTMSLKTIGLMKEALSNAKLNPHLMCQPIGYHTPDVGKGGLTVMPETPFGISLFNHCHYNTVVSSCFFSS